MDDRSATLLEIGRIVGIHGLRGDLKVRPLSGDPDILLEIEQLLLRLPSGEQLTVTPCRQRLHKGQVLLRLQGYESINAVEHMVGGAFLLAEDRLPPLQDDEFYWHQLQGMTVIDRTYGELGQIEGMFTTAAHDTYVVRGMRGEVLVPAVEAFIREIDLEEQTMRVDLPEGLIPEQE